MVPSEQVEPLEPSKYGDISARCRQAAMAHCNQAGEQVSKHCEKRLFSHWNMEWSGENPLDEVMD